MGARDFLRDLWRDDCGFIFLIPVVLLLLGGSAITVYGGASAVHNNDMIETANKGLVEEMQLVEDRTAGSDDPRAKETHQTAMEVEAVASDMQQKAEINKVLETVNTPVSVAEDVGSTLIGGPVKAFFGGVSKLSYGKMAYEDVTAPKADPDTTAYVERIDRNRFRATTRILGQGGSAGYPPIDPNSPIEVAIVDTALDATTRATQALTGASPEKSRELAKEVYLDEDTGPKEPPTVPKELLGSAQRGDYPGWVSLSGSAEVSKMGAPSRPTMTTEQFSAEQNKALGPLEEGIDVSVAKVDPSKAKGAKGAIVLTPDDQAALKSGEKTSAIGTFMSPSGPKPVVVNENGENQFTGTFPTLDNAPKIQSDAGFQLPKKKWQGWWDGSRKSCPFLFAWNGQRFSSVNDIISVSRDPLHEYPDFMRFDAERLSNGTLEVRVSEIRSEESFLDRLALWAVDVPHGYGVELSPDGHAYSVGAAHLPFGVSGASMASLSAEDGRGFRASSGASMTATFDAPSYDAVLLLSVDGFEQDAAGRGALVLPAQRPGVIVEALADGRWTRVGEVRPRENRDTSALDVSPWVRGGKLTVRIVGASCFSGVYQLVDRIALSTARRDLAHMRPVVARVSATNPDAADLLACRDGRRMRLSPGETVSLAAPYPRADALVVESVGWYRELSAPTSP